MAKYFSLLIFLCLISCKSAQHDGLSVLRENLYEVVNSAPGTVGVAFLCDRDTGIINNGVHFPMMSVVKMHQSIAVIDALEKSHGSLDSVLYISANELDPDTWSPMLKERGHSDMKVSVRELMNYAIISSDNNASNLLFSRMVSPAETDKFIKFMAPDTSFSIRYSEADMKANHELSYSNYTTPLAAACLIRQLFNSQAVKYAPLKDALSEVTTGQDRLGAVLEGGSKVQFAHKTGSGYRNDRGELMAFNDVGYFCLPDGRDYALAVFIRDFRGSEAEAAAVMAKISELVYNYVNN